MTLERKKFIAGSAAVFASINVIKAPAKAAQFEYKFASNAPISHPLNTNAVPMWEAVRKESGGRLDVKMFPNNQLGGDTAMLTQLRSGAIQFFPLSGGILTNVVPVAGIQGVPFFILGDAVAVSGAQPVEVLKSAIERVISPSTKGEGRALT